MRLNIMLIIIIISYSLIFNAFQCKSLTESSDERNANKSMETENTMIEVELNLNETDDHLTTISRKRIELLIYQTINKTLPHSGLWNEDLLIEPTFTTEHYKAIVNLQHCYYRFKRLFEESQIYYADMKLISDIITAVDMKQVEELLQLINKNMMRQTWKKLTQTMTKHDKLSEAMKSQFNITESTTTELSNFAKKPKNSN